MSYVTSTDVTNAGGDTILTLLCGDGSGGVSDDVFSSLQEDVDAEIESILGPGVTVPLDSPVAKIIRRAGADIMVYFLYERKPEFSRSDGENPAFKRYQRAVATLKEIKSGERDMPAATQLKSKLTSTAIYGSTSDYRFIIVDDESSGNAGGF